MSVQRIYVKKRKEHGVEADKLFGILKNDEGISSLESVAVLNRYDIEGISQEQLKETLYTVFCEPMVDDVYFEEYSFGSSKYFSVEYLPGQYDQRADSAEQCIKVITGAENVKVRCAKTYVFHGELKDKDIENIKGILINSVDQRVAYEGKYTTLAMETVNPAPVGIIENFINFTESQLKELISSMGLAMNIDDILYSQNYFKNEEKRNPTETELRLLDTYWSDHCRHTTFNTILDKVEIEEGRYKQLFEETLNLYYSMRNDNYGAESKRPVTLMDMAVIGAKDAKKRGLLNNLEESDENNACSVEIDVNVNGGTEKWLLQFKNETHNHPTEIEPYGGAATCVGGAVRDPLSGRAYVYQSMRITGAGNPYNEVPDYLKGKKLPQRKITRDAAKGFSSYGNQLGLATGYVQEFYHDGYVAKRLETGAVIGAVPKRAVRREKPVSNDCILLIGGRTGRDGVGGATGSSKEHDNSSIEICGAEVQKGNAPEEHKIQRLFRKENVSLMIKKCNDFGAGGISVAIGELADGLNINLNAVLKKYEGLTGSELALSESQERMAVVIDEKDLEKFKKECDKENIECSLVARVTNNARLQMYHDGRLIVDISREFLDSAGASRHQDVILKNPEKTEYISNRKNYSTFRDLVRGILSDLNICSQKGMVEMFDSTIGASTVITPFGGVTGNTPSQCMAAKIPVLNGDTTTISLMSSGFNPYISEWSPYHGAYYAVIESVSKIITAGGRLSDIRLSFQEFFERLGSNPDKWGKPFSALLGTLKVQKELGIAAIGGKDSMSGTFKDAVTGREINVPPTLISFAVSHSDISRVVTNEFKVNGGDIYFLKTPVTSDYLLDLDIFKENAEIMNKLILEKSIISAGAVTSGGVIEALSKMAFGNMTGINIENISLEDLSFPYYGSFIIQSVRGKDLSSYSKNIVKVGSLNNDGLFVYNDEKINLSSMVTEWEEPLEHIFPSKIKGNGEIIKPRDYPVRTKLVKSAMQVKPEVAVLALPGTNCEYDTKRIFEKAGSREVTPFVFRNLTAHDAVESCKQFADIINRSQILVLPGGFSAGDEPEGSGKFYVSVLKNGYVREAVDNLVNKRDGLVIGICNGFQALIKTGILTYGHICDLSENDATLSFNTIGRHVSQMVRTRVASVNSPWMSLRNVGEIDIVPVSHGEGRFTAPKELMDKFFTNGQVLFQYVDLAGNITMESPFNPNGSTMAVEGICSPCGRVLGKMGHSERIGNGVHINNAYGNFDQRIFEAGVRYFTGS